MTLRWRNCFRTCAPRAACPRPILRLQLATRPEVVQALEQGALFALPPWPETYRVVATYGTLLNLDVQPLLRRIYAQVEAGIVELAPKSMPDVPFMAPPDGLDRQPQGQPASRPPAEPQPAAAAASGAASTARAARGPRPPWPWPEAGTSAADAARRATAAAGGSAPSAPAPKRASPNACRVPGQPRPFPPQQPQGAPPAPQRPRPPAPPQGTASAAATARSGPAATRRAASRTEARAEGLAVEAGAEMGRGRAHCARRHLCSMEMACGTRAPWFRAGAEARRLGAVRTRSQRPAQPQG